LPVGVSRLRDIRWVVGMLDADAGIWILPVGNVVVPNHWWWLVASSIWLRGWMGKKTAGTHPKFCQHLHVLYAIHIINAICHSQDDKHRQSSGGKGYRLHFQLYVRITYKIWMLHNICILSCRLWYNPAPTAHHNAQFILI